MEGLLATSKKSRAKSCTSCRQVKLRCNAREKYPDACSRCSARNLECRMDMNFKRVNTRSSLGHGSPMQNEVLSGDPLGSPKVENDNQHQSGVYGDISLSPKIVSRPKSELAQEKWLCFESSVAEPEINQSWILEDVELHLDAVLELYQQFEDYYYVHLPILEPIKSFQKLYRDSSALFWTILFTASRHHPRHSKLYDKLREPFRWMILNLLSSPVQGLKDLQALVIVCQWPFEVGSQSEDPSLMHCGFVTNAALHMGLDKFEDEVLFGHRRAKNSLELCDPRYRRWTWMKIFQISTQLSTWHGLRPQIASASSLQRLSDFYGDETSREMIALTDIQREVARSTTSLDDLTTNGPQVSLAEFFTRQLDAIRQRFADVWSKSTEINLQGAKLYCYTHCLLLADIQEVGTSKTTDAGHFVVAILQQGHSAALALIKVIKDLGMASMVDPSCTRTEDGGCPLLAHPKQHLRLAFYASLFLLKYIDCHPITSGSDHDAARNAVSTVYQVFKQFQSRGEALRAAQTIEVLVRSVVPGKKRMKTWVKTRMGASLNYNAIWAAAKLRGRQHDPEYTPSASSVSGDAKDLYTGEDLLSVLDSGEAENGDVLLGASARGMDIFEQYFPWGVWDDAAYDELGFEVDDSLLSGVSGVMGSF